MFEHFTAEARAAVTHAQQVARETASQTVDSRHLLIALLESPGRPDRALRDAGADPAAVASRARADLIRSDGIDAEALAGIGIDLDAVRQQADAVFGPGALDRAAEPPTGHIPFSPDAKKSLEWALRATPQLRKKAIDTGQLMLGVLGAQGAGGALLLRAGVDTDALRTALERADVA